MNWLYLPLSYLRYANALLVHIVVSFGLLLVVSAFVLARLGLVNHIPWMLAAQTCLYFFTPIGFTHLERGQFDTWVAIVAALCVAASYWPNAPAGLGLAAGLLGSLKWTCLPFLGCFCVVAFVFGKDRRRWVYFCIPVITAITTALFYSGLKEYWRTIEVYELTASPRGLTLQHVLPRTVAQLLPVVVTLLVCGVAWARPGARRNAPATLSAVAAPFSLALMNLTICFGTVSYEYHTVATLGLLPGLVIWIEKAVSVSLPIKAFTAAVYAMFLSIAFRPFDNIWRFSSESMTGIYVAVAVILLGVCLHSLGHVAHSRIEAKST